MAESTGPLFSPMGRLWPSDFKPPLVINGAILPWRATWTQTKSPLRSSWKPKAKDPDKQTSVFSHELFNLTHHAIQFVDEIGVIAMLTKGDHKRSVIPKRAVLLPPNRSNTSSPCLRNSARIARVLCNLSLTRTPVVWKNPTL